MSSIWRLWSPISAVMRFPFVTVNDVAGLYGHDLSGGMGSRRNAEAGYRAGRTSILGDLQQWMGGTGPGFDARHA
ncbi:MAG: hypothetical protein CM1200mP26_13550 [Acidimicrobiales bacterium]|nr:MAG: hypothetical protein CM1200mP26_13550 [Acidimicrobiales bacterium]